MNHITQPSLPFADIVAPVSPTASQNTEIVFAIIAVSLFFIFIFALWRRYHSGKQASLRQLKHIYHACVTQRLTPRMACFRMAMLLKQRLGKNHLPAAVALPATLAAQQQRWDDYIQHLHRLRYARQSCNLSDIETLVAETRFWLRRWP